MPNYCYNSLVVEGHQNEIDEFIKKSKGENGEFSFNHFIPMPNNQWNYDWCVENWGTKWDAFNTKYAEDCIYFCTAYSPPTYVIERASSLYPNIKFILTFGELLMNVSGEIIFENGECKTAERDGCNSPFGCKVCDDEFIDDLYDLDSNEEIGV